MRALAFIIVLGIGVTPKVSAGEPSDLVPLTGPPVVVVPWSPPSFYRPSRWDVWQNYGVARNGQWRPRVVLTPEPHYLYNGAPYGLLPIKPRDYIPHIFD